MRLHINFFIKFTHLVTVNSVLLGRINVLTFSSEVIIRIPKHNPKSKPKFHHVLIFDGEGKSINAMFDASIVKILLFDMIGTN